MLDLPEFLWETNFCTQGKICLLCASRRSVSMLRTTSKEIIPVCDSCSKKWDFYRYNALKINVMSVIGRAVWYKIRNPFKVSLVAFFADLVKFSLWASKIKKWSKKKE